MAGQFQGQHDSGADDPLGLLAQATRRSPLQELRDYPFFAADEARPERERTLRHGGAWLTALALVIAVEVVVLALLLR